MQIPASQKAAPSIPREEAVAFMRKMQDAINAHDVDAIMDSYAEDAVLISPVFKRISGRAAIASSFQTIFETFPDWRVHITDVLLDGNRIAGFGEATATDRKGWFGLPPTGEKLSYRPVIMVTLIGGKIVQDERLYDLTAVHEHLEKTRIDRELKTAAEVQTALLSRTASLGCHYEAAGDSVACRSIGGDFFEFIELPSGGFGVALGDVAGKGPAAALLAAMLQGMFASEARAGNSPSATLSRINQALADRGLEWRFATLVYGVLSPDGRFVYSNAGHNPPVLLGSHGIRRLAAGGPILGALKAATYQEEVLHLNRGDTVIMYSDGVTESQNDREEEFGEARLISCVTAHRNLPPAGMAKHILSAAQEFSQGRPQNDDITVTVTRYLQP
jgi:sigma-B regulation protein RsbU (phosphoserine phosphatase)